MMDYSGMDKKEVLTLSTEEFLGRLETSIGGLSQSDAHARLLRYGKNVFVRHHDHARTILIRQLRSSLVYLLLAATLISYSIGDYSDGTIIAVILLINITLSFFQEYRSEKIIEKLEQFITTQVRLRRDDKEMLLDTTQIVPGDVLMIREGDIVPADMRLLQVTDLEVNESQLTGESLPVIKQVSKEHALSEKNLVFTGSIIERGVAVGVVYATGKNTELGAIAELSLSTKKETPYEQSLQSFSTFLVKFVFIGLAALFISKLILNGGLSNISGLLLFIIAMAVAVVPEVLPVIATISLSRGALALAQKHVVVKRLSALEDLGNVNLLCTDKTGTITENKMQIRSVVSSDVELFQILAFAAIAPLKTRKHRTQNSYDDAFFNYVSESLKKKAAALRIIKELPFDPNDRRSRMVLEDTHTKKYFLVVIGAPEVLLQITKHVHTAAYLENITKEGKTGLHHLALAYREVSYSDDFDILKHEEGLTFLGYVSMDDPLRPGVKNTLQRAEKLGIRIKILTGDSREVAQYIGEQIGLMKEGGQVYLGNELEKMSPSQLEAAITTSNIFARVTSTQKYNIIKILKKQYVVAYQGDGINDAPALKLADVAIAVNSATDIAKENADIVLLKSSLEVIINGIKYGRSIFVNINKYIKHTMVSNFGNFIALSMFYLFSTDLPLLPIQILLTSLITDIPMIMISTDSTTDEEVVRPEKHNVRRLMFLSILLGIPTALFEIFYFLLIRLEPQRYVETSLYIFLTFIALIVFYSVRSERSFWNAKKPSTVLNISFALAFLFSLCIIYIPQFQIWFSFAPLSLVTLAILAILTLIYFFIVDVIKVWYFKALVKN